MNTDENVITISLSKGKIVGISLLSLAFVVAGVFIWSIADTQTRHSPEMARIIAALCILFFGLFGLSTLPKLFDRKPGLVISPKGIFENSNSSSVGWIDWNDIYGVDEVEVQSSKQMIILVSDPKKYAKRRGPIQKMIMKLHTGSSTVWITSKALDCEFSELKILLEDSFLKYSQPGIAHNGGKRSPLS
ncbi:hypothetical protein IEN85_06065 [Pelagicoccus sp. NFK12]|uniref:Uncharacterized protein n=1 Tax=Pelagicoccus enzymogenes TaxID=2773457 RepID=A0A927F7B5_9BACT|nr:STM3941 family protein [Pelagicoccus enzymogenes]MBD5779051.1 hypothetical protein [Pelagicoccus enzymogenes]